jgi:hypothetical protein
VGNALLLAALLEYLLHVSLYSFQPRLAQGDKLALDYRWICVGRSLLHHF